MRRTLSCLPTRLDSRIIANVSDGSAVTHPYVRPCRGWRPKTSGLKSEPDGLQSRTTGPANDVGIIVHQSPNMMVGSGTIINGRIPSHLSFGRQRRNEVVDIHAHLGPGAPPSVRSEHLAPSATLGDRSRRRQDYRSPGLHTSRQKGDMTAGATDRGCSLAPFLAAARARGADTHAALRQALFPTVWRANCKAPAVSKRTDATCA